MSNVSQISDSRLPDQIACLMIPMDSATLLLPNEAVAEVVSDLRPEKLPDLPEWCLGEVEWRGLHIPVISYEKLSTGADVIPTNDSRLVVINTTKDNPRLPFYALLSQHAPRLVRAFKDELTMEDKEGEGINKHHVIVNVESAIIPDLEMMEEKLLATPQRTL
ncbi:MAG: chemotaxis protein CheW [Pseudomonadales bacterium]|nr:chemotaxis protein CheW [Pseudomonadales bacterium]